jgi:hypothetical protein
VRRRISKSLLFGWLAVFKAVRALKGAFQNPLFGFPLRLCAFARN